MSTISATSIAQTRYYLTTIITAITTRHIAKKANATGWSTSLGLAAIL
jgi:hypothetical protein